jgi:hypothetical protein
MTKGFKKGEDVLFHEIYNIYYRIASRLIERAETAPISERDMKSVVSEFGFRETLKEFKGKFYKGHIPIFYKRDGGVYGTPLKPTPRPLSLLEKRWLATVLDDGRMRLFLDDGVVRKLRDLLGHVEPLYKKEDFRVVDGVNDPDPFDDPTYVKNFRIVMGALRDKKLLKIRYAPRDKREIDNLAAPVSLQYSMKDDKFRLACAVGGKTDARRVIMNMSRVIRAEAQSESFTSIPAIEPETKTAVFRLWDERGAPERAMIHFSHYECEAYKNDNNTFMNVKYNREDETEVLIRALSFGPQIQALKPKSLVSAIKERLELQYTLTANPQ